MKKSCEFDVEISKFKTVRFENVDMVLWINKYMETFIETDDSNLSLLFRFDKNLSLAEHISALLNINLVQNFDRRSRKIYHISKAS